MRTIIIEDLELPEDRCAVLSREAMRQNKPLNVLLRQWLLEKAEAIVQPQPEGADRKAASPQ